MKGEGENSDMEKICKNLIDKACNSRKASAKRDNMTFVLVDLKKHQTLEKSYFQSETYTVEERGTQMEIEY